MGVSVHAGTSELSVHLHVCVHICVDVKEHPLAVPWILPTLFLKIESSLALKLTRWARLVGQRGPGTCLSLVP